MQKGLKASLSLWYFIFFYKNLSHYLLGTTAMQVAICEEKGFFKSISMLKSQMQVIFTFRIICTSDLFFLKYFELYLKME